VDAEASSRTGSPAQAGPAVNLAVGGWFGVIAIQRGAPSAVTGIGAPAVKVAISIGVTSPESSLATKAVLPSGDMATSDGVLPTVTSPSSLPATRSKTVTLFELKLTTNPSLPSGVIAISLG